MSYTIIEDIDPKFKTVCIKQEHLDTLISTINLLEDRIELLNYDNRQLKKRIRLIFIVLAGTLLGGLIGYTFPFWKLL